MIKKYDVGEFKNVYRPRSFDYVVGQESVKKFFINSFANKSMPQAMLFEGPKGTGKTTIARIVAMALNCVGSDINRSPHEPCTKCDNCKSILTNSNPDYNEVNVADKTGVNDMRALTESFLFAPMYLENKIYILDEAQQLTKPAQNKLLKDLEDTPENVYIIFCTTDSSSLIGTLIERCYKFTFERLTTSQLTSIALSILDVEGKSLSESVINLLVSSSDGSARRLLVNLHKLLVIGGDINIEDVVNILGSEVRINRVASSIYNDILHGNFSSFSKQIRGFNHKECHDLCFSLLAMFGSRLLNSNDKKKVSYIIDCLEPCLSVVNKGVFINAVYKCINGR